MESELMENDPFANINETLIEEEYKHHVPIQEYFFIIGEFLVFLACLTAIAANVFLSTTIIRFKKLRTRLNISILIISLLNVLNHLMGTLLFLIELLNFYNFVFITIILQFQNTVQGLHVVFSVILALDWFLSITKPHVITLYNAFYKIIFFALFIFFLIEGLIAFAYAEMHHYIRFAVFKVVYIVCLIIMIFLNIAKRFISKMKNPDTNAYAFTLSNIFVFAYLPVWIYHTLSFLIISIENHGILIICSVVPAVIWIIHPIIVVYVLGARNKYFKMAYMKAFHRSVNDYDDDNLDEESGNNVFINNAADTDVNNKVENGDDDNNKPTDNIKKDDSKINNKDRNNENLQEIDL